ncbi:MAG: hypothetical protein GXP22_09880 [Gammaproteobacteria bacterium]|nr:hypothetical protein [Gammaproteobacteria bacterium]
MNTDNINNSFNNLSLREKVILGLVAIIASYSIIDIVLTQSVTSENTRVLNDIEQLKNTIILTGIDIESAQNITGKNPADKNRKQLLNLQNEIDQLTQQIKQKSSAFIKASTTHKALDYIINNPLVPIRDLTKKNARPLFENKGKKNDQLSRYQYQEININFSSGYLNNLEYIYYLENNPWGLIIDKLIYESNEAGGQVEINLHTISVGSL